MLLVKLLISIALVAFALARLRMGLDIARNDIGSSQASSMGWDPVFEDVFWCGMQFLFVITPLVDLALVWLLLPKHV